MTIRTSPWPAGVPCWADLTVPDMDVAKAFYGSVLGWTFRDLGPDYADYAIAESRGADAATIGPAQDRGPSAWTLYIASDDVDKTAAAVVDNGGTVLLGPGEVGPLGRMALAADPTGVRFAVWQAGTHFGAGVVNEPGGLIWEDLRSPDPDAARAFYSGVFGYRMEPTPGAGPDYTTFALAGEDEPRGGIGGLGDSGSGEPGQGQWVLYFGVSDTSAAIAAAEQGGGSVVSPAMHTPYGRMAGLADPNGALFWVVQTQVPSDG